MTESTKHESSKITKYKRGKTTMAEIKEGLEAIQETQIESQPTISSDERAELETLRKQTELYKSDLSGKDKKLTELQKEIKAKMSDEERIKAESQSVLNDLLEEFKGIASGSLGLDDKHKALIKGSNKDEIKESADLIKSFKESITKDYEKQIKTLTEEINILKANGTPPPSGQGAPTNERERLISLYNAAEIKGDGQAMFAIKEQIQKLPK